MTKYGMAVDTNRCTGCNMCTMVCRVGHNLPNGVMYSQAVTEGGDGFRVAGGTYPDKVVMDFYTLGCQHCDEPYSSSFFVAPVGQVYTQAGSSQC